MTDATNQLITRLPRADQTRFLLACQPVQLLLAESLHRRGDVTRYAYFPEQAFISLVTHVDAHPSLEVGLVGDEGMVGVELLLGVRVAPLQALVQGGGLAWRITAAALQRELQASRSLRQLLQCYLYVRMSQQAGNAACLRFHLIGPRLARWLLMSQDRAHADHFRMTHEFLASMLGVRRVGITAAAGALQRTGLIHYHRGEMQVLDRPGLEAAACSCYATDLEAMTTFMG